ncbi:hypothetical protein NN3_41580 [Nocardia neocaledoniensis NBRC 108232]|uniref:CRISPR system Cascade subunit CasB n=1 Tax=Nocardia neocaledoniensis TaxID=236511 RepID=A0A317NHF1_9NOCA|nr:type I-E CRISPR-associated protein Cse2/CasB [Nocardia neocaledoniensis]PWV74510.1 CRISPR system Cascade subunit CasB [Nocardia neocaledoniensis]GEM33151.1 hypothetical protein NN3_41580 [Nocardia neocaledoniensis NBRC 108232]
MPENRHGVDARARALVSQVEHIHRTSRIYRSSRAARAELRRTVGLAPDDPRARGAHRIVAPHLPFGADAAVERAFYAVAAMIAAQPRPGRGGGTAVTVDPAPPVPGETGSDVRLGPRGLGSDQSAQPESEGRQQDRSHRRSALGPSFGVSLAKAVAAGLNEDATAARLQVLCRQSIRGLHRQVPRLAQQIRERDVEISWERLLVDLADWGLSRDVVARWWLQDFYRTLHTINRRKSTPTDSEAQGDEQL